MLCAAVRWPGSSSQVRAGIESSFLGSFDGEIFNHFDRAGFNLSNLGQALAQFVGFAVSAFTIGDLPECSVGLPHKNFCHAATMPPTGVGLSQHAMKL